MFCLFMMFHFVSFCKVFFAFNALDFFPLSFYGGFSTSNPFVVLFLWEVETSNIDLFLFFCVGSYK